MTKPKDSNATRIVLGSIGDVTLHEYQDIGYSVLLKMYLKKQKNGNSYKWFKCQCKCGKTFHRAGSHIVDGIRRNSCQSCGCQRPRITSERTRLSGDEANFRSLLSSYKKAARKRKHEWNIDEDFFRSITKGRCFFCGKEPFATHAVSTAGDPYIYNGIDRVDSSVGYEEQNCVSCCWGCNRMKGMMSVVEFIQKVRELAAYNEVLI